MRDPELYLGNMNAIAKEFHTSEDPRHIQNRGTTRLATEVQEAIKCDPIYGPMHDKDRHLVGIEYEVVLEYELKKMGQ